MNEYKLINDIELFKQQIDGLPLEDIRYYQQEFKEQVKADYNILIEFNDDGDISY